MDNLEEVLNHLIDAQMALLNDKIARAKMELMAAQMVLKRNISNYFARVTVFRLATIRSKLARYKIYQDEREAMADDIELMIAECIYQQGERKVA